MNKKDEIEQKLARYMGCPSLHIQRLNYPQYTTELDSMMGVVKKLEKRVSFKIYKESKVSCKPLDCIWSVTACDDLLSDAIDTVENTDLTAALALSAYNIIMRMESMNYVQDR